GRAGRALHPGSHRRRHRRPDGRQARGDAHPTPAAASVSRCWAVTGAVGGSGATTLAIEIANQLCGRQSKEKAVCLIDLNLADGSAAAYLGSTPAMRLAE